MRGSTRASSSDEPSPDAPAMTRMFQARGAVRALLRNPSAVLGALVLLLITVLALLSGLLYPGDPLDMVARPLLPPLKDPAFWLGSDSLGRNVAAGLAHGAKVSLLVGVVAAVLSLFIGVLVGALGGYFGGVVDDLLVRLTELVQTIPSFLLVIVIVAIGQPKVAVIVMAIGLASWPMIARLVRAEFRSLRESEFVLAARSQGFSDTRIIFQEILPNALPPVIVSVSVLVATAILMESALAFIGLGDPNIVSWGSMIGEGREHLRTAWTLSALPGIAILLTVLSLNLVGDGLNDALNPRLRSR
jgi:peptide/nickel transport system permease protein